jgi:hypothetical protein
MVPQTNNDTAKIIKSNLRHIRKNKLAAMEPKSRENGTFNIHSTIDSHSKETLLKKKRF